MIILRLFSNSSYPNLKGENAKELNKASRKSLFIKKSMFPLKPQSNYIIPIRWRILVKFAPVESIDRNVVRAIFNQVIHKLIRAEVNINASFLGVENCHS